ncbi:MAG: DUF4397 domain-containing protein [Thermoflexales bacterium]|nr:DUF4397 domain-containing protein [Thermoflexales bacterium]
MQCTRRAVLRGMVFGALSVGLARFVHAGTDTARFRILHAAPSLGAAVDVYGNRVRVAQSLDYGAFSRLWAVPAESILIRVFAPGANPDTDAPLGFGDVPLTLGRSHTIVITEEGSSVRILVFPELDPPPRGQIALRVAHVAPGAPTLDLVRADSGSVLLSGIPFGEGRAGTFAPGLYTLVLRESGIANDLLNLGTFRFRAGARRTFYVLRTLPSAAARDVAGQRQYSAVSTRE